MTPMIVEHPLLQHKLSILRNKQTGTKEFRDLVGEIATLLCYEATRDLPLEEVEIETPITMAKTKVLAGRKLALVPILRAGMGPRSGHRWSRRRRSSAEAKSSSMVWAMALAWLASVVLRKPSP